MCSFKKEKKRNLTIKSQHSICQPSSLGWLDIRLMQLCGTTTKLSFPNQDGISTQTPIPFGPVLSNPNISNIPHFSMFSPSKCLPMFGKALSTQNTSFRNGLKPSSKFDSPPLHLPKNKSGPLAKHKTSQLFQLIPLSILPCYQ